MSAVLFTLLQGLDDAQLRDVSKQFPGNDVIEVELHRRSITAAALHDALYYLAKAADLENTKEADEARADAFACLETLVDELKQGSAFPEVERDAGCFVVRGHK